MQSTRSNEPASTGSSSTAPSRSACGFSTTSTPTYSRAVAKNGRYGFTPQPTSSTRSPPARRPSSSSQRASGARTAQLGSPRDGSRCSRPGGSRIEREPSRGGREAQAEPRQRLERYLGDEAAPVPRPERDE